MAIESAALCVSRHMLPLRCSACWSASAYAVVEHAAPVDACIQLPAPLLACPVHICLEDVPLRCSQPCLLNLWCTTEGHEAVISCSVAWSVSAVVLADISMQPCQEKGSRIWAELLHLRGASVLMVCMESSACIRCSAA